MQRTRVGACQVCILTMYVSSTKSAEFYPCILFNLIRQSDSFCHKIIGSEKNTPLMMLYLLACTLLATLAVVRGDICTSEETKTFTVSVDLFASELGTFFCGCC